MHTCSIHMFEGADLYIPYIYPIQVKHANTNATFNVHDVIYMTILTL